MLERGHEMSSHQLDELWHLDFKLAYDLLDLPLRKCTAVPVKTWGKPMDNGEFERLKLQIRRMWLRAAMYFSSYRDEFGWGLKVFDGSERNLSLTESSFTVLGWLAVSPSPQECPTGHRYLRSPVANNLYLGGPISLANWSSSPSVKCWASTSKKSLNKCMFYVSTRKTLPVSTPITWNYGMHTKTPSFHSVDEWQVDECCSERSGDVLKSTCLNCKPKTGVARRPSKRLRIIQAYRFCMYCGINLDAVDGEYKPEKLPPKKNMKPHIALNHTVQLCLDQGLEVDNMSNRVSYPAFLSQLHMVTNVLTTLENHNYVLRPACHIFEALEREKLPHDASRDEKDRFFSDFMCEAKEAFRKYKVLYVRGISIPSCYEDLLPVSRKSYEDVSWEMHKAPRSNTFSVKGVLSEEQMATLEQEIQVSMENIIKTYSDL